MPVGRKPGASIRWKPSSQYGSMAKNVEIPPSPCESKFCDQLDYKRCEDTGVMCKAFLIYLQKAHNSSDYKDKDWNASHVGIFRDNRCNHCYKAKKQCELKCENWRA